MNILITGAGGRVGRLMPQVFAAAGHTVRTFDLQPVDGCEDAVVGDLLDFEALRRAADGMDAVVHLAGIPGDRPMAELAGPNIVGVEHLLRAARDAGVRRVAFASSLQVIAARFVPGDGLIRASDPLRPMTPYACTKAFGEALGRHYADAQGLEFVAIRLGCCFPYEASKFAENPGRRLCWISPRDAAQVFLRAVEAPGIGFEAVFATSMLPRPRYELVRAREVLGYEPLDDLGALEFPDRRTQG